VLDLCYHFRWQFLLHNIRGKNPTVVLKICEVEDNLYCTGFQLHFLYSVSFNIFILVLLQTT